MKKSVLYVLSGICVLAIVIYIFNGKKVNNNLRFAYNEYLKLSKGEKLIEPITIDISNMFSKYSFVKNTDIVLNKAIKGKNITLIGISLQLTSKDFARLQARDTSFIKYFEKEYKISKSEKLFYSFFLKKSDIYIFRTIYSEPQYNDLIMFDVLNKDSVIISKLYNSENFIRNGIE